MQRKGDHDVIMGISTEPHLVHILFTSPQSNVLPHKRKQDQIGRERSLKGVLGCCCIMGNSTNPHLVQNQIVDDDDDKVDDDKELM